MSIVIDVTPFVVRQQSVEEPERPGVLTFTWSIRNFSRCMSKENEYLGSPSFYIGSIRLYLKLYPKGDQSPGFASFYLGVLDSLPEHNTFTYVLSFQKCNGLFKESTELRNGHWPQECRYFLSLKELHKPNGYLNHDVLTLRCRVWKKEADLSKFVHCFAETRIKIAKLNYLWMLEGLVDSDGKLKHKLRRRTDVLNFSSEFPDIIIHLSTSETFDDDEAINFAIDKKVGNDSTPLLVVYRINLLQSHKSIVLSKSGEALFSYAGQIHKMPFLSMQEFNKKNCLTDGKLIVQFELSFSGTLEVEKVEYGVTDNQKFNLVNHNIASLSDAQEVCKENMRQFYSEGKYSDLIVRTPKKEFPVHRAILCAHSIVFDAMLTHDMKEKNSGVIEITDFDDETVSKMLMYLYTNTLDDIDYALAKDLYLAADKYRIKPLQIVCSKKLMGSIDASNVCDILLLADQLRDEEMKSLARDFILSCAYEIMNSSGWKNLMETNLNLTSETMQWMILENFLNHKK